MARTALFCGRPGVARAVLARVPHKIHEQIEDDGSQPREFRRANALIYSAMNLRGFLQLAVMAGRLRIELDAETTPEGRALRAAVRFLREVATGEREVSFKEHAAWRPHVGELLAMAGHRFGDPGLLAAAGDIDSNHPSSRVHLTQAVGP